MSHTAHNPKRGVESNQVELASDRAQIDALVARLFQLLADHGYPEPSRFAVRLALEEALSNAFRHGHKGLPPGTPVRLEWRITSDELSLTITDKGPGFDPDAIPDPTLDENLERPGGRGIMLMRAYMTRVEFDAPGNKVTLVYQRPRK